MRTARKEKQGGRGLQRRAKSLLHQNKPRSRDNQGRKISSFSSQSFLPSTCALYRASHSSKADLRKPLIIMCLGDTEHCPPSIYPRWIKLTEHRAHSLSWERLLWAMKHKCRNSSKHLCRTPVAFPAAVDEPAALYFCALQSACLLKGFVIKLVVNGSC